MEFVFSRLMPRFSVYVELSLSSRQLDGLLVHEKWGRESSNIVQCNDEQDKKKKKKEIKYD